MQMPYDVESHLGKGFGYESRVDRQFKLIVRLASHNRPIGFRGRFLMELVKQALAWRGKALRAHIESFEDKIVVSPKTVSALWAADAACYGRPSARHPFIVRGPTINPTFIEEYTAQNIWNAVRFGAHWIHNSWNEPYWVKVLAPNGTIVVRDSTLQRMYRAEIKAQGGSIVEYIALGPSNMPIGGSIALHVTEVLHG